MYLLCGPQDEDFGEDVLITAKESKREAAEADAGGWGENQKQQSVAANGSVKSESKSEEAGSSAHGNDDDDEELYGGVSIKLSSSAGDKTSGAPSNSANGKATVSLL